jgi:hypothetical protein
MVSLDDEAEGSLKQKVELEFPREKDRRRDTDRQTELWLSDQTMNGLSLGGSPAHPFL